MRHWWWRAIASVAILSCGFLSACDESQQFFSSNRNSPDQRSQTPEFKTHVEGNLFSFQYPHDWSLDSYGGMPFYIVATNYPPEKATAQALPSAIRTGVALRSGTVEQLLAEIEADQKSRIIKKEVMTVNGQKVVRCWLTTSKFGFTDAIVSYIPYGDRQIGELVSYYGASNPQALPTIEQVHQSFRLLQSPSESKN
uniref:PsbP-related protein n=1 Tax=Trichocoleus desertorum TaxID=1481672 RepID=UPI0025B499C6|nr:PsbP-related protein [Trichocoleus desertorum]